jgi:hypothetical protein
MDSKKEWRPAPSGASTHALVRRRGVFLPDRWLKAVCAPWKNAEKAGQPAAPSLAHYYVIQDATTKRCRIVEERPAPAIGVVIGGAGFGVRTEVAQSSADATYRSLCFG